MTLKIYYALLSTVLVSALVLDLLFDTAEPVAEQTPAAVKETVFNVDGLTCWAGNNPTLVYDTTDSTAKITITCKDEVLFHYLPAIERTQ